MATLFQLPSGRWRVQIRRKGRYISETFLRHRMPKTGPAKMRSGSTRRALEKSRSASTSLSSRRSWSMRRPHGVEVVTEEVFLARTALMLLGLIGKGKERDRRPTQDELDRLLKYLDRNNRPTMPVGRMVQFAIATAMRQEEICSITWKDIDVRKRIVVVRDRKDPSQRSATTRRCHSSAQRAWTLGRYGSGRNSLHRTPSAWFLTTGARLERRSGALAEI